MAKFQIPENLIEMLRQRRVIPFVGAGLSSSLGLPTWDELLKTISNEISGCLPYDEIKKYCTDSLQIAEYYLLKCDHSIGPLRHSISNALHIEKNPVLSAAHVELINLGAPQIYTTNFDDFIERTFKNLGVQAEVIALPKDVATSHGTKAQIVKYHGDLKHEQTLVLTESSYYSRLDFESPMDLKFRSDLLGRSVLFMGYSFRDINIRVIWFKLIRMMKDIPPSDRPNSYIVRFEPNPILEMLYDDVGIKTIVLDPENEAKTNGQRSELFNEFMFELAFKSSIDAKIPGSQKQLFLSNFLLDIIESKIKAYEVEKAQTQLKEWSSRMKLRQLKNDINNPIHLAANRKIPNELVNRLSQIINDVSILMHPLRSLCEISLTYLKQVGSSSGVTFAISRGLTRAESHNFIIILNPPWEKVWASKISKKDATIILDQMEGELKYIQGAAVDQDDFDIAYICDIVKRIADAQLIPASYGQERERAAELLKKAESLYESVSMLETHNDKPPNVESLIDEIKKKREQKKGENINFELPLDDDIPF